MVLKVLSLKVSHEQRVSWQEKANAANMALSAWIKMACDREAGVARYGDKFAEVLLAVMPDLRKTHD